MVGPERLSDGPRGSRPAELLRSMRGDRPSPQAKARLQAALGIGAGLATTAVSASAGAAAKSTGWLGSTVVLVKWVGVAVLAGGIGLGALLGSGQGKDAPRAVVGAPKASAASSSRETSQPAIQDKQPQVDKPAPSAAVPARKATPGKGRAKAPESKPAPTASAPIHLELPDSVPASNEPPIAGQMTEQAAHARRLFDGESWGEAAPALDRVQKGETGDDAGNRQIAEYNLAICLYRLRFYQASFNIFSRIADNPSHLKFNETLLWLSKLAIQLPEPADVIERVGKYKPEAIERFNNTAQRDLYGHLNYLLGRYKYRNRQFEEAIQLLRKVGKESKYFAKAQFFLGTCYVQLHRSVPAIQSFQRVVSAIDEGVAVGEEERMRDLAYLSMARTYYTASIKLDDDNSPTVDARKLSAAVKYWNKINEASEYWLDGLFEESWAYYMAEDYPRALGNIFTIQSPYFPDAYYPEADILKAVIYFSTCQYDDATTIAARFSVKYKPIKASLETFLARYKGQNQEAAFYNLLRDVRAGRADLPPTVRPIVESSLSDRQLLRNLEYVRVLDSEDATLRAAPATFRTSALGGDVKDAVDLARELAIRNAGSLTRDRYLRTVDQLNEHLRDAAKILIDVSTARRRILDEVARGGTSPLNGKVFAEVDSDDEHIKWPFDGEYWRDELGTYRQVVYSKCGR